jgi:hypothetical protein
MKRIMFVVVLAAVAACAFAQYAGSVLLGGGLNGYMNTDLLVEYGSTEWTNFSASAYGGYFVADGFEVGPWISLYYDRERNESTDILNTDRGATLGVQVGYFFMPGSRFTPFVALFAGYRLWTWKDTTGGMTTGENSGSYLQAQLHLGMDYLLSDAVALKGGTYFQYSGNSGWSSYELRAFFGLDVFLGSSGG